VVEVDRPRRPTRRSGAKSDALDAVRAAWEALAREHLAAPRRRGDREALRERLVGRSTSGQIAVCAALAEEAAQPLEQRMTVRALRSTARRIQLLEQETAELQAELAKLVATTIPALAHRRAGRADRGRTAAVRVVTPGPAAFRGGVCGAGRGGAAPGQLGPGGAPSAEPVG
jgi:hypothetical protein